MKETNAGPVRAGFRRRRRRGALVTCALAALTFVLCALMLTLGNTNYSLATVLRVLSGEEIRGAAYAVGTLRLPRMLAGLLVGVAFGVAGNTFQTMLRNPLASPDIIGITSGASAAAVFCILVLHLSGAVVSAAAVAFGLLVAGLIYLLSIGARFSGGRLILIGIGIQAMLSALISYMLLKTSEYDVASALRWMRGSVNGVQMQSVPVLLAVTAGCTVLILTLSRHLRVLELGEEAATALGLGTNRTRGILIVAAVLLIAFAAAVTGPVAFVAFLAGPIAVRLAGAGANAVIPSGLVGACLVLGGDLIGQFALPSRYPVGVVTGVLGAPYLIFLLIRLNQKGGTE